MFQILIAILGGAAVMLVNAGHGGAGAVLGLLSQPFWILETWRARQWGMFALSVWYTVAWGVGLSKAL